MTGAIYPELVQGRLDDVAPGRWQVREGSTQRGSASCDLRGRVLEVPLDTSALARVVRAHELMHARVSPVVDHLVRALEDVSPRALECAEEFRVNTLLGRVGFDVTLLRDGTEKAGGTRVADADDWPEALSFLVAVVGTGAERDFLSGVRRARPQWLGALRAVAKRVTVMASECPTSTLAATHFDDEGRPAGFASLTLPVARLLTQTQEARIPSTPEELRGFRRSLQRGGRRPPTGRFAALLVVDPRSVTSAGRASVRGTRPATSGPVLRYPGRLLTDPQRRAFARRASRRGGVVVIDQSGSMDLRHDELVDLVRAAPDALVVGYSHRPGDHGATANAWLLARQGWIAPSPPVGNVGNGVDGPVLEWALTLRRSREPFIWLTDGQVTDSNDHPSAALSDYCATLVRRHQIRLVRELKDVPLALRHHRANTNSALGAFGRLGRALRESRDYQGL